MKTPFNNALRAGFLAAALACGAAAHANPTAVTTLPVFSFDNFGIFNEPFALATLWKVDVGSASYLAFCVDPGPVVNQVSYAATPIALNNVGDNVRRLYEMYYSGVTASSDVYNSAFQVALWEFNNDTGSTLASGNLNFSADEIAGDIVLTSANNMVIGVNAATGAFSNSYSYLSLTAPGSQGLMAVTAAVPEASEWAMLVAGLGMLGFLRRRKAA